MTRARELFLEEQEEYMQDSIYLLESKMFEELEYEQWQYEELEENRAIITVQPHFTLEILPF